MNKPQLLYLIQECDLEAEEIAARLERIGAQLGDRSALQEAEKEVATAQSKADELGRTMRHHEADLEGLEAKLKASEKELYGGSIKNPKELEGLRMEVESLRERRSRLEDKILELMSAHEEAKLKLEELQGALEAQRAAWEAHQRELQAEKARLEIRKREVEGRCAELTGQVEPKDLALYRELRRKKAGRAVALLQGDLCLGCRVSLPSQLVQEARRGSELVTCSSCGRILCPSV